MPVISRAGVTSNAGLAAWVPSGASRTFAVWVGSSAEMLVGKRFADLLPVGAKIYYETHIAPALRMQGSISEIALDVTCSDPEACAAMAADPLIRHVATPRWFNEVRATQARLRASATLLKVPTFMPVPGEDRLVDSAAATRHPAAMLL